MGTDRGRTPSSKSLAGSGKRERRWSLAGDARSREGLYFEAGNLKAAGDSVQVTGADGLLEARRVQGRTRRH